MSDKRFIVFGYELYEASGGMGDSLKSFDNIEEAIKYSMESCDYFYKDIYDRVEGKTIWTKSGNNEPWSDITSNKKFLVFGSNLDMSINEDIPEIFDTFEDAMNFCQNNGRMYNTILDQKTLRCTWVMKKQEDD